LGIGQGRKGERERERECELRPSDEITGRISGVEKQCNYRDLQRLIIYHGRPCAPSINSIEFSILLEEDLKEKIKSEPLSLSEGGEQA
jgi:hypothetical protein